MLEKYIDVFVLISSVWQQGLGHDGYVVLYFLWSIQSPYYERFSLAVFSQYSVPRLPWLPHSLALLVSRNIIC